MSRVNFGVKDADLEESLCEAATVFHDVQSCFRGGVTALAWLCSQDASGAAEALGSLPTAPVHNMD